MPLKESSDELNPTVAVSAASVPPARPARSFKDYFALAIATCGVGYLPLAPGTWGSLVGLGFYVGVRGLLMAYLFEVGIGIRAYNTFHIFYMITAAEVVIAILLCLIGAWAASRVERLSAIKDPSIVVIDEVAGQYIALLPVAFMFEPGWWSMILAFVLFRFFDIVKPYPARNLEALHGGLGIMGDDVVAGAYAAAGVMLAVSLRWIVFG